MIQEHMNLEMECMYNENFDVLLQISQIQRLLISER